MNLRPLDLKFLPDGHHHILNGEEVPGCSSIAAMFDRGDWRIPWGVKMMYEKLKSIVGTTISAEALLVARDAWRDKRDRTADIGIQLHSHIERYIKERLNGRAPAEAAPSLIADAGHGFALGVIQFLEWEKFVVAEWLASELQVAYEKHRYAGILDALYRAKDNHVYLVDVKTSEKTKQEWLPQLVGLKYALEDMGQPVDHLAILHLPRGGVFKCIPLECDYEREFKAFLVAKDFYAERNMFEKRHPSEYKRRAA